ncbi:MAG TPA: hypothetical protein VGO50_09325 [Pyrinomonadaceae bacterium]|nr:hypothetical protein [Pyrinomonadaceae bacterium]
MRTVIALKVYAGKCVSLPERMAGLSQEEKFLFCDICAGTVRDFLSGFSFGLYRSGFGPLTFPLIFCLARSEPLFRTPFS